MRVGFRDCLSPSVTRRIEHGPLHEQHHPYVELLVFSWSHTNGLFAILALSCVCLCRLQGMSCVQSPPPPRPTPQTGHSRRRTTTSSLIGATIRTVSPPRSGSIAAFRASRMRSRGVKPLRCRMCPMLPLTGVAKRKYLFNSRADPRLWRGCHFFISCVLIGIRHGMDGTLFIDELLHCFFSRYVS